MTLDPPQAPQALADYRAALATDSPEAVLLGTVAYFDSACASQVVPPLTIDPADLKDAPDDTETRIRAVRDRLRRLGYPLPKLPDPAEGLWGPDVVAVIARFVAEARLPVPDATAGELTALEWDALQEFFGFEDPLDPDDWFDAGVPRVPLLRAVRLRLSVLGFGPPPAPDDFEPDAKNLASFADLALRLGGVPAPLPTAVTPPFVAALFDHDALVARLANCGDRLDALRGSTQDDAEDFLICIAKIELWLFGYDVVPDGTADLARRTNTGPRRMGVFKPTATAVALSTFWNDTRPPAPPGSLRVAFTPLSPAAIPRQIPVLLARMAALRAENESALPRDQGSAILVSALEQQLVAHPTLWDEIKTAAANMVGALFDGIRRVLAWVRNLIAKAWDAVATATYNLWRAVYHFMGAAAFNLRRAFAAIGEGAAYVLQPARLSAPVGCAAFARRFDGDALLIVDPAGDPAEVLGFARALERGAMAFAIACRIFRLVVTSVRTALLGVGATLGGFVPLILGLASAYSQIRPLIAQLDALDAFDAATTLALAPLA